MSLLPAQEIASESFSELSPEFTANGLAREFESDSLTETQISRLLNGFEQATNVIDLIIPLVPRIKNTEHVSYLRDASDKLGEKSWRLKIACDSELIHRAEAKRGRGHKDLDGIGVVAQVRKLAYEKGVSARQIFLNDQIHKTFFKEPDENIESAATTLGPTFFRIALSAEDPKTAIKVFAKQKDDNPFFSTRDAEVMVGKKPFRRVDFERVEHLIQAGQAVVDIWQTHFADLEDDPEIRSAFNELEKEIKSFNEGNV